MITEVDGWAGLCSYSSVVEVVEAKLFTKNIMPRSRQKDTLFVILSNGQDILFLGLLSGRRCPLGFFWGMPSQVDLQNVFHPIALGGKSFWEMLRLYSKSHCFLKKNCAI